MSGAFPAVLVSREGLRLPSGFFVLAPLALGVLAALAGDRTK
jgi:hypothetical protein